MTHAERTGHAVASRHTSQRAPAYESPALLIVGEGRIANLLENTADRLGISHSRRTSSALKPSDLYAPSQSGAPATTVVLAESQLPKTTLKLIHDHGTAHSRVIPRPELWQDLWSSESPQRWLRNQGMPTFLDDAGDLSASTRPHAEADALRFILPLVCTHRGDHVMLPIMSASCVKGRQEFGLERIHRKSLLNVPSRPLTAGVRKRCIAISQCLAERISTGGIFAVEFAVLPEESVQISRVLSFPVLASMLVSETGQASLAHIHLAALFDLPLPNFDDSGNVDRLELT